VALVAALVADHIRHTRAEPGCLSFDIVQAADDPCRWDVAEAFTDRVAFEAHQARTRSSPWWMATRHMPRHFAVTE
jgi:quinol monooxygenase YgiN